MRRRRRSPLKTVRQQMGGRPVADGRLAGAQAPGGRADRELEPEAVGDFSGRWVTCVIQKVFLSSTFPDIYSLYSLTSH